MQRGLWRLCNITTQGSDRISGSRVSAWVLGGKLCVVGNSFGHVIVNVQAGLSATYGSWS